jgi:hypothetical protein
MNTKDVNPRFSFRNILSFTFAVMLAVLAGSCDITDDMSQEPSNDITDGKGKLVVRMHDNPGNYDEVWVEVDRVEVNNQADPDTGWVVISEPQERYNLLELVNGAHVVLGEAELDAGHYPQIRLILGNDNSIVVNGTEYGLQTPSAQQTGLKLNVDAEIEEGHVYNLYLDFDVSKSIVRRGPPHQAGSYLLKPVIRAYTDAATGSISGIVDPVESDSWIYALVDEDTLSSTRADTVTGAFLLSGLQSGTYSVYVDPANEDYESVLVEDVVVAVRDTTDLGTIEIPLVDDNDENGNGGNDDDEEDDNDNDDNDNGNGDNDGE